MAIRKLSSRASRLPWPLYSIDFEASSLEPNGYPIEDAEHLLLALA